MHSCADLSTEYTYKHKDPTKIREVPERTMVCVDPYVQLSLLRPLAEQTILGSDGRIFVTAAKIIDAERLRMCLQVRSLMDSSSLTFFGVYL